MYDDCCFTYFRRAALCCLPGASLHFSWTEMEKGQSRSLFSWIWSQLSTWYWSAFRYWSSMPTGSMALGSGHSFFTCRCWTSVSVWQTGAMEFSPPMPLALFSWSVLHLPAVSWGKKERDKRGPGCCPVRFCPLHNSYHKIHRNTIFFTLKKLNMASVVKRRAVLEPSKLNRDSQKAGVTMVRVVLSALVYAGKNQSPCLHETLTTTAHEWSSLRTIFQS